MRKSFLFVSAIVAVLVLSACGANVFEATNTEVPQDEATEKQRFIDATVEMTCAMMRADNLSEYLSSDNRQELNKQLDEIYKRHGFDVTNSELMEEIAKKYEDDDEVFEEIQLGLIDC